MSSLVRATKGGDDAIKAGKPIIEARPEEVMKSLGLAAKAMDSGVGSAEVLKSMMDPFAAMGEGYDFLELKAALKALSSASAGLDQQDKLILESELVRNLKRLKAPKPSELARGALGKPDAAEAKKGPIFPEPEPWPEAVSGQQLLGEIEDIFRRYTVLPEGGLEALVLWPIHTYFAHSLHLTPRLALQSPEHRCGKTTVVGILKNLVLRPLTTANLTPAVLFRAMDEYKPTLIADEADAWLKDKEELRGIIDVGFDRTCSTIFRCSGEDHSLQAFDAFGPMCLAGIRKFPTTIQDRSIVVPMRRKRNSEKLQSMRSKSLLLECQPITRKIYRWANDNIDWLSHRDPNMPTSLHDRAADCWRPLIAIADLCGGDWPDRSRRAAETLTPGPGDDKQTLGGMILEDIKCIFEQSEASRLPTGAIIHFLVELEERPWAYYGRQQKPINPKNLANLLKPYGISSTQERERDGERKSKRGYSLRHFQEAFARYL